MSDINFKNIEKLPVDFEEIVSNLKNRIQTNLPEKWKDFLTSNFGVELLEAVAYEATLMFYYSNASVNECFLPTARTRTSVFNIAKTLGYKPSPASQATVILRFYLDSLHDANISIPKYTVCTNTNNINFYTIEDKILYANEKYIDITAKSGALNTDVLLSTGIANYKYKLLNNKVNSILSVLVDDVEYEYTKFIDIAEANNLYTVDYDSDGYGYISFGDGVYGANPGKGLRIEVTYVTNSESKDNVDSYTITKINDVIYDENNRIINDINVINNEFANGASSEESLEEIKRNVPSLYRTQNRSVLLSDAEDLSLMINGINKVKAIDNSILDEIGIFGVKLCLVPDNGGYLSEAFKQDVLKVFKEKKIVATQLEIIDPSYVSFDVYVGIKISPTTASSVVSNQIRASITNYLNWKNRELGEAVSNKDIYNLVASVNGVLNINSISIEEKRNIYIETTPVIGSNTVNIIDNMNVLDEGSTISLIGANDVTTKAKIKNIDKNNNSYALNDIYGVNFKVTPDMKLSAGCFVYPTVTIQGQYDVGDKELYILNDSYPISTLEKRNMILLNMSYCSVYFNDDTSEIYRILYRIGDTIYLDRGLVNVVSDNSTMTILYKNYIPVLASSSNEGSTTIKLDSYPRFDVGGYLIDKNKILYKSITLTVFRDSSGYDDISNKINSAEFIKIDKVYVSSTIVLTEGITEDYTLINNGKTIKWTASGALKVPFGSKYYVDLTKKTLNSTEYNEFKYYVKNISKKSVYITPALDKTMIDGSIFDYSTDIYRLMPYEIADCGTITISTGV